TMAELRLVRRPLLMASVLVLVLLATTSSSRAQFLMGGWGGYGFGGYPWGFGYTPAIGYGYGLGYPYAFGAPFWGGLGYGGGFGFGGFNNGYGFPGYYPYFGGYGNPYLDGGWTLASGLSPLAVESVVIQRGLNGVVVPQGQQLTPGRYKLTITVEPDKTPPP